MAGEHLKKASHRLEATKAFINAGEEDN